MADRDDVLDYVGRKYGFDHVGLTSMFMTFGAKGAIREIGKVFGYPNSLLEKCHALPKAEKIPNPLLARFKS